MADLINFGNVWSCGTETAVSLPCMFGLQARGFQRGKGEVAQKGLLDVLQRAGLMIEWRDNQSGCKGVCDRGGVNLKDSGNPACAADRCGSMRCCLRRFARGSTNGLAGAGAGAAHDGQPWPTAHYKRYPDNFEVFKPTCKTSRWKPVLARADASIPSDNTLRYTDAVLAKLIGVLREHADQHRYR